METPNRSSGAGGMVVTLVVGAVVGFLGSKVLAPSAPPAQPPGGLGFVAQPCPSQITPTMVFDSSGQPSCVETGVRYGDSVTWATTPGYYPWVRFTTPAATPGLSASQGYSSWSPLATYTPGASFGYQVNVLKTSVPTPGSTEVTPTPQLYGRIIIKP